MESTYTFKQIIFALRKEYIEAYKRSLVSQLENLYFVEPDGTKTKVIPKDRNKKQ